MKMEMIACQLNNHFVIVRHGESVANIHNLVVTDPDVGCIKYGLTANGKSQAKLAANSIQKLIEKYNFALSNVCICYSDFKRTKETAQIIYEQLSSDFNPVLVESKSLRERRFGELDKNDGTLSYEIIWKYDKLNPNHNKHGVESVNHTLTNKAIYYIDGNEILQ